MRQSTVWLQKQHTRKQGVSHRKFSVPLPGVKFSDKAISGVAAVVAGIGYGYFTIVAYGGTKAPKVRVSIYRVHSDIGQRLVNSRIQIEDCDIGNW